MDDKENKRAPNFSPMEESLLITLVNEHKHILECKETDAVSNQQKNDLWKYLSEEFNSCNDVYRNEIVLRNKYRNLKKRTKHKLADEKYSIKSVGCEPPKNMTDVDNKINKIFDSQIMGFKSEFDDDAAPISSSSDTEDVIEDTDNFALEVTHINSPTQMEEISDTDLSPAGSSTARGAKRQWDWSSHPPLKLNQPPSVAVTTNSKSLKSIEENKLRNKLCSWAEAKIQGTASQEHISWEQHELIKAQMCERQQQDMLFAKEKHEQEMAFAREEHQLKIQILKAKMESTTLQKKAQMCERHQQDMLFAKLKHEQEMAFAKEKHEVEIQILKKKRMH